MKLYFVISLKMLHDFRTVKSKSQYSNCLTLIPKDCFAPNKIKNKMIFLKCSFRNNYLNARNKHSYWIQNIYWISNSFKLLLAESNTILNCQMSMRLRIALKSKKFYKFLMEMHTVHWKWNFFKVSLYRERDGDGSYDQTHRICCCFYHFSFIDFYLIFLR